MDEKSQIEGRKVSAYITLIHHPVLLKLCSLFTDTYAIEGLLVNLNQSDANINWNPT